MWQKIQNNYVFAWIFCLEIFLIGNRELNLKLENKFAKCWKKNKEIKLKIKFKVIENLINPAFTLRKDNFFCCKFKFLLFKSLKQTLKKNKKTFLAENTRFFEYYVRILALKLGDNLIWYGTLRSVNKDS